MARVLVAGESWSTTSIHTKGFDSFITVSYSEGVGAFRDALSASGHLVEFMPNHVAASNFPDSAEALGEFDVVVLSDIGANTLLIPPDTFASAAVRPNRLLALRDWVRAGGALAMIGGYLSFQGIEAKANYRATPLAEVLPVDLETGDDREEASEGARCEKTGVEHPITTGLDTSWPILLGFQRLTAKLGAEVLATVEGRPLLVTGSYGSGRSLAFASDIGPHWVPPAFSEWTGYRVLWSRAISWLAKEL